MGRDVKLLVEFYNSVTVNQNIYHRLSETVAYLRGGALGAIPPDNYYVSNGYFIKKQKL
jgi:hypothetical protein